jgi:hypothetical protein
MAIRPGPSDANRSFHLLPGYDRRDRWHLVGGAMNSADLQVTCPRGSHDREGSPGQCAIFDPHTP